MIALVVTFVMVGGAANASNLFDRIHFMIKPAGLMAIDGHFNDTTKLREIVSLGLGLGVGFRYKIVDNIYLDFGYSYNWLSVKEDFRPFDYQHQNPAFEMQNFCLNGNFYLASGYSIEPFFTLGVGVSSWRFSQNTLNSDSWQAPGNSSESFSDISPLVNIGLGLEVYAFNKISFVGEVKYNYLFSRNVDKLGTDDFTQQDYLTVNLGLIFRFGN